jgi:SAM-dependent methyltransferase
MALARFIPMLAGKEARSLSNSPVLFDTDLLARRRARAAAIGGADFLHRAVADDVIERLNEVNRACTAAAIIGPRSALWDTALTEAGFAPAMQVPADEALALDAGSHDLVLHALALHWANDPVGQLVQSRRALRPDGLFIAALFGGETLHELRAALAMAEVEVLGGLSPRISPMGEIRELGALLQRAGFALTVADSRRFDVSYAAPVDLMRDLRAMGETNMLHDRLRRPLRRDMLALACAHYADRFGTADGRVTATFEVIFLTGWAPAPGQQQPLRPGSARARLADALGVPERSAGERAGD